MATFSDATLAGWSSSLYMAGNCPSLGTVEQASGGNPGAFLQYRQSACNQMVATHFSAFSRDPSTQGALDSMSLGYDGSWLAGSFQGDTRIGLYFALYNEVSTSAWTHFGGTVGAAQWCSVGGCGSRHPDFSASGGLIEFGLATSNNCPGCSKTLSGGLDNYSLTLNLHDTSTVPEPAGLALVGLGLAALAGVARRRAQFRG